MSAHEFELGLRALTYVIAIAMVLNLLDDLFIDLNYFLRGLYRRSRRRLTRAELVAGRQQRIAIMVPAWREADVIAEMLEHNLSSIDYDTARYMIFCGTYQNDPGTQACVDSVSRRFRSVRKVVVPHDGPTSKADCLNWIYQGVILEEELSGERFDILLMHDAEDIIHALSLRLYNSLIPGYDFVQTPVFSLELRLDQIVAATYIDEFAEHHLKDMLVREAIGGLVPSAGVGSAFARGSFEEIATAHDQKPFNVDSLTEDYEIATKFRLANKRVHFACRTLERPLEADGASGEEYLATREYFPSGFSASVRQRSRWICGITLQTWQQLGWKGSAPVLYCLWRDRKAVFTNLVVLLAYALMACFGVLTCMAWLSGEAFPVTRIIPRGSLLASLLAWNAFALCWRALLKAYFVGRLYGPVQALLSAPRLIVGNVISMLATLRALRQYAQHRISGEPLRWLKTAHHFPSARTLRARARMLGECLIESGLLTPEELQQALRLQLGTNLPLGTILTSAGLCSGKSVASVLSAQWGIDASVQIDAQAIPLLLLRALPERSAERLDVLPLSTAGSEASVAVARQLTLDERAELESILGARLRLSLAPHTLLEHARRRAYRRLLEPTLDETAPLGARLIAAGQLSEADLERTLEAQGDSGELLGELLLRAELVSPTIIASALRLGGISMRAAELGPGVVAPDSAAIARLGAVFCALHSIVPLMAAGGECLLATAFPVSERVLTRVRTLLAEPCLVYAPMFRLRDWLARAQRLQPLAADFMPSSIAALDGCELLSVTRAAVWQGSPEQLWDACCAAGQEPIAYLESSGYIGALEAAQLRARAYQLPLLESDDAALVRAQRVLPPRLAEQHSIAVLTLNNEDHSATLAAPKPTPELARTVARCLPRWAIAWSVASPQRMAAGSSRQVRTWNDQTTTN
jgi:adsorption protein B